LDLFEGEIGRHMPIRWKHGRQHLPDMVELPGTLLRLPWGVAVVRLAMYLLRRLTAKYVM
jgi:hypothetical protein